jgi:hypothetical protein
MVAFSVTMKGSGISGGMKRTKRNLMLGGEKSAGWQQSNNCKWKSV